MKISKLQCTSNKGIFISRISSFLRIFEGFRLNEWKSCFFFRVVYFFPASKIRWMNDMWTCPRKKRTQKNTKNTQQKKNNPLLLKKKRTSSKSEWMADELFRGKKKTHLVFFLGFGKKKNTIFWFEWMNGQRTFPRKKNPVPLS